MVLYTLAYIHKLKYLQWKGIVQFLLFFFSFQIFFIHQGLISIFSLSFTLGLNLHLRFFSEILVGFHTHLFYQKANNGWWSNFWHGKKLQILYVIIIFSTCLDFILLILIYSEIFTHYWKIESTCMFLLTVPCPNLKLLFYLRKNNT